MADYIKTNEIQTRISLKYDSYSNWSSKNPVLLKGEVAIATIPQNTANTFPNENLPNVVMKVGDGTSQYNALPFVSALAADVYEWAKAATKPSYAISEISNALEYRLATVDANNHKYALQARKAGSEEAWVNVADSAIDLSGLVASIANHETRIGTVEGDLNTAETGLKARMTAAEAAIEGITSAGGAIGSAINEKIQTLDANLSKTVGGLTVSLTQVDGVVTAIEGSIAAKTYDVYGAADDIKTELTEGVIKTNADAIDVIEGNDAGKSMREVAGEVVSATVSGLGATVNHADTGDGLTLSVTQENGLLKSVSGSIAAGIYDVHGAAATVQGDTTKTVKEAYDLADSKATLDEAKAEIAKEATARDNAIKALVFDGVEGTQAGATIKFVDKISQANGIVSAELGELKLKSAYVPEEGETQNLIATMKDVTAAVADLNGAMHFEGVYETLPTVNKDGEAFKAGDVIIVGKTEYVFSNGAFVELGDEGAIAASLSALSLDATGAEDKTLVISQSNGKVTAEAKAIKIAQSQVIDLGTDLGKKLDKSVYDTFKSEEFTPVKNDVDTLKGTGDGSVAKKISDSLATLTLDEVGAVTKTLKVKQENGKVTAEAIDIAIEQAQVNGLPDALNAKLDKSVYDTFKSEEFAPVQQAINNLNSTIVDQIEALDADVKQDAGNDGLALHVVQEDGVIKSISGSIAANTYAPFSVIGDTTHTIAEAYALADAAQTADEVTAAINTRIEALDNSDAAVDGEFVTAAVQTNGTVTVKRAKVNIKHLTQDENSYVVFNCGSSEINI